MKLSPKLQKDAPFNIVTHDLEEKLSLSEPGSWLSVAIKIKSPKI